MWAPDADCSAPIVHCDADCDYDSFDDGPRDKVGWTKKERARRARAEERCKAWTRWYNRKKRLQVRSQARQAEDRCALGAMSSTRPHTDSVCSDVYDKYTAILKKLA